MNNFSHEQLNPNILCSYIALKAIFFYQSEYQRGVSAWNFDVEDLKNQASLVLWHLQFTYVIDIAVYCVI